MRKSPGAMALPLSIDPWQAAQPLDTYKRWPSDEPTGVRAGFIVGVLSPQAAL